MAIEFGTGVSRVAASALVARTPSVRKSDSRPRYPVSDRTQVNEGNLQPRAGFGEGTISALGVAATTVDRNLESARKIVPTLDELSADARARAEALREEAADSEQERAARSSEASLRNENAARAQAQGFERRSTIETPQPVERATNRSPVFTISARNVESVVSLVVPEPSASFDVFG